MPASLPLQLTQEIIECVQDLKMIIFLLMTIVAQVGVFARTLHSGLKSSGDKILHDALGSKVMLCGEATDAFDFTQGNSKVQQRVARKGTKFLGSKVTWFHPQVKPSQEKAIYSNAADENPTKTSGLWNVLGDKIPGEQVTWFHPQVKSQCRSQEPREGDLLKRADESLPKTSGLCDEECNRGHNCERTELHK